MQSFYYAINSLLWHSQKHLSVIHRWLYWIDSGLDQIERASMDGTSRTVLINSDLSSAYALTLDYNTQTLYWADASYDKIEMSSANGTGRTLLTTTNILNPWDITFFQGRLYWSDTSHNRILSTDADSASSVDFVGSSISGNPHGVIVISEDRQPEGI